MQAGIGFDAAAPATSTERAVGLVGGVAEFHGRGPDAREQLAVEVKPHADTDRQQDRGEIRAVAVRRLPAQGFGDHIAFIGDFNARPKGILQGTAEMDIGCGRDRRGQQRLTVGVHNAFDANRDAAKRWKARAAAIEQAAHGGYHRVRQFIGTQRMCRCFLDKRGDDRARVVGKRDLNGVETEENHRSCRMLRIGGQPHLRPAAPRTGKFANGFSHKRTALEQAVGNDGDGGRRKAGHGTQIRARQRAVAAERHQHAELVLTPDIVLTHDDRQPSSSHWYDYFRTAIYLQRVL